MRAAQGRGAGSRVQSEEPRPRVCRRLFAEDTEDTEDTEMTVGATDNLINQISELINRDLDEASKKYNFDFRSEVPLDGDWVWERLQSHPSERRAPPTPPPSAEPTPSKEEPLCEPLPLSAPRDKPAQAHLRL